MPIIANTEWARVAGNDQAAYLAGNERVGIIAKGHAVQGVGGHVSLRLIPNDQERWRNDPKWGSWFTNYDSGTRRYFATIGAGPASDNDSTTDCGGSVHLASNLNRDADVNLAAAVLEKLHYIPREENSLIQSILERGEANYHDNELPYCFLPTLQPFYNSNSFVAGLLKASSITAPDFPTKWSFPLRWYAGWTKPVPSDKFDAH
jgi:hypothetical protein